MVQLPEPQFEQELPVPAIRVGTPALLVLKQANVDSLRRAALWHFGHEAASSDLLNGRSSSKPEPHSEQTYS